MSAARAPRRGREGTGGCGVCHDQLEHCHETLILHEDGTVECRGGDCGGRQVVHTLVIRCGELVSGCGCAHAAAPTRPGAAERTRPAARR